MAEFKSLKIKITEKNEEILNLNLPFSLLSLASKFIPDKELKKHGIELKKIYKILESKVPNGSVIEIANLYDKSKNTHVEIFIE